MKFWWIAALALMVEAGSGCGVGDAASPWWIGEMGTAAPGQPRETVAVPEESVTDTGALLCWRGDLPQNAAGFHVYENGKLVRAVSGTDTAGGRRMERFFAQHPNFQSSIGTSKALFVTGLTPETAHWLTIRPVTAEGKEFLSPVSILVHTKPVRQEVRVTDFGASPSAEMNTEAIQRAIDACPEGGRVVVPAGVYRTGALRLHSDMELYLTKEAVLLGSDRAGDYPVDSQGRPAPLLSLRNGRNVSITGEGTIDGNGWAVDANGAALKADNRNAGGSMHVFRIGKLAAAETREAMAGGDSFTKAYQKRSTLISIDHADRVFLAGITFRNPAMHGINLSDVRQAALYNVAVETYNANNGDGIDFRGQGLLVADSYFDTGDDAINFNAGVGERATREAPTSDAWLFHNFIAHGHGGVVLGSHTAAWIERILAEHMVMDGTDIGLRGKTGPGVGGGARDVLFRQSVLYHMQKDAFSFVSSYTDPSLAGAGTDIPAGVFMDISVEDCDIEGAGGGSVRAEGQKESPFERLSFRRLRIRQSKAPVFSYVEGVVWKEITMER